MKKDNLWTIQRVEHLYNNKFFIIEFIELDTGIVMQRDYFFKHNLFLGEGLEQFNLHTNFYFQKNY